LERFELASWAGAKVGDLSKGMQQKVQFIVTIANRPKLIILDEPFSGLDPLNTQLIEEVITELKNEGTTIVFSTHRMEQVEELCSRIVLINDGEAVLDGEVAELRRRGRKNIFTIEAVSTITDFTLPQGWELILQEPLKLRFSTPDGITAREVLNAITPQLEIIKFEQYLPGLREIFIEEVSKRKPTNAVPAVIPA
jgi:ABC-2 type transport system ATP-binding protein